MDFSFFLAFILITFSKTVRILFLFILTQLINFMKTVNTFFSMVIDVLHAKLLRESIRSTKTGDRERSITNWYFISEANSPLIFKEEKAFKNSHRENSPSNKTQRLRIVNLANWQIKSTICKRFLYSN